MNIEQIQRKTLAANYLVGYEQELAVLRSKLRANTYQVKSGNARQVIASQIQAKIELLESIIATVNAYAAN